MVGGVGVESSWWQRLQAAELAQQGSSCTPPHHTPRWPCTGQEAEVRQREAVAGAAAAGAHAGEPGWPPAYLQLHCCTLALLLTLRPASPATGSTLPLACCSLSAPLPRPGLAARTAAVTDEPVMVADVHARGWPCVYATEAWCRTLGARAAGPHAGASAGSRQHWRVRAPRR